MKAQAVDSIEKEIEHLETGVSENENSGEDTAGEVTKLNDKIKELTALKEDVNAAESFDEFRELMSSEMKYGKGPVRGGRGQMHEERGSEMQGSRRNMS
jgi:phage shock protein A